MPSRGAPANSTATAIARFGRALPPVWCAPLRGDQRKEIKMKSFISALQRASAAVGNWRRRYREYVSQCITSGFIPTTFRPLQLLARYLALIWVFAQVGRLKVIGKENLASVERTIYCPNHSSMFDAPIVYAIMKRFPRYMTAYEEMRGLWGLKAVLMGACGSFPVDRSHGKSVLEPAINVLARGDPLVIFPEGKISASGQYLPFKIGAALIALNTYERLGRKEKVCIVPVQICLPGRDPNTALGPYGAMGLKWRKGAAITAANPIWVEDKYVGHPEMLMEEVRARIIEQPCPTSFV